MFRDRKVLDSHLNELDPFRSGMPGRTTAKHKIVAEFRAYLSLPPVIEPLAEPAWFPVEKSTHRVSPPAGTISVRMSPVLL